MDEELEVLVSLLRFTEEGDEDDGGVDVGDVDPLTMLVLFGREDEEDQEEEEDE